MRNKISDFISFAFWQAVRTGDFMKYFSHLQSEQGLDQGFALLGVIRRSMLPLRVLGFLGVTGIALLAVVPLTVSFSVSLIGGATSLIGRAVVSTGSYLLQGQRAPIRPSYAERDSDMDRISLSNVETLNPPPSSSFSNSDAHASLNQVRDYHSQRSNSLTTDLNRDEETRDVRE